MMKKERKLNPKKLLLIGIAFFCYILISNDPFATSIRDVVGLESASGPAKDFTLNTIYGTPKSLASYHGKAVLLTFWTTWCPTCRKQMGSIQKAKDLYQYKNFAVLTVNMDDDDSNVGAYMSQNGYSFTVLYDKAKSVGRLYGVRAFPTSFIVDSNGSVVDKVVGGVDWTSGRYGQKLTKLMGAK